MPSKLLFGKRMEHPVVSIMIPCYKRATFLHEAIESALGQKTNIPFEVVVIDNATDNDALLKIVETFDDPRLSYYRNEQNIGMSGNWNRCIELAQAGFLCLLHDDDLLCEDWLEEMWRQHEAYPNAAALYCDHLTIGAKREHILWQPKESRKTDIIGVHEFYFKQTINIYGLLFSKEAAMKTGGIKEEAWPFFDVIFTSQLLYQFGGVPFYHRNLAMYRVAENESLNPQTQLGFFAYPAVFTDYFHHKMGFVPQWFHRLLRDFRVLDAEGGKLGAEDPAAEPDIRDLEKAELNQQLDIHAHPRIVHWFYRRCSRVFGWYGRRIDKI